MIARCALASAALLALLLLGGAPAGAASPPETVARVRDQVYPALVNITVVYQRYSEGRAERYPGAGSGVIVSAEGHVLTNFHVAGNTTRIDCTLTDGRVRAATVVAHDPLTDLSVLKLQARAGESFPHAEFGDSDALQVGDTVFAMGNPLALSSSMTEGIVSNPARVFTDFTGSEIEQLDVAEGEPSGLFTRWIQHDALILPGNSGGPLVDVQGKVVGINELGGEGFGFAIPSAIAREVLEQVLALGEAHRGTLGFSVLPVAKISRDAGALVSSVLPGSPAEKAGVVPGDVLLQLAGEPVTVRFVEQVPLLYQRVARLPVGTAVELVVERGGQRKTLSATVERLGPFHGDEGEVHELGVTLQEITPLLAASQRLPGSDGLLVTGVHAGGPADAAKPRLQAGDVLNRLGGEPVGSLPQLRARVAAWPSDKPMPAAVWRAGEELLALLPPPRAQAQHWGGELPKAWIGVRTQVLTPELAAALGTPELRGFRVTQVLPGTAAAKAGLAVDDVITGLNGDPLQPARLQEAEDLRRAVEELTVGGSAKLAVWHGGATRQVTLPLEPRPPQADEVPRAAQETLEFAVRELTLEDRVRNRWSLDVKGVLVADADRGGWAQMAGLRLDDLLLAVNDEPVPTVADFQRVMKKLVVAKPKVVRLFLRRGGTTHFVILEPVWHEVDTGGGA
ncbi:MAG TPA: PDZ domain-containing protein [Thermoanaerobaculia bacterium]|nr:PDZ domain-containing protein [Thermoanaerobaculia bacterium]